MVGLIELNGPLYEVNGSIGEVTGGGYQIGDQWTLTAGHIAFEFNMKDKFDPIRINESYIKCGFSKFEDYRGYVSLYVNSVRNFWDSPPTEVDKRENLYVESRRELVENDTVVVQKVGSVSSGDSGLVYFANSSDMLGENLSQVLGSSASVVRVGQATHTVSGNISSATDGWLKFDQAAAFGDSGGAYLLKFGSRSFVIGTQSSTSAVLGQPVAPAYGTYFTGSDFGILTELVLRNHKGNVTNSEPTNLIVGTNSDDGFLGSGRPDILLSRDGDDFLDGGDISGVSSADIKAGNFTGTWANDQLHGGAGNDIFVAGMGSDLCNGGGAGMNADADGIDTLDYSALGGETDKGIRIILSDRPVSALYSGIIDTRAASYVTDLGRDKATDTLVSIEYLTATDAEDVLQIESFNGQKFAGTDGQGGFVEIDLGIQQADGPGGGDLIDFSLCDTGAYCEFKGNDVIVAAASDQSGTQMTVHGAERVIGSRGNDVLKGDGTGRILEGGAGADRIYLGNGDIAIGGKGADQFHVSTAQSNQVLILGFEAGDQLFIDGVRYTGTSTSADLVVGPPDSDGVRTYNLVNSVTTSSYNGGASFILGGNGDYWTLRQNGETFRPDGHFALHLTSPTGADIEIDIADYQRGEGNFRFISPWVDGDFSQGYTLRYTDGMNYAAAVPPSAGPGATGGEPVSTDTLDFTGWINQIPATIANHDVLVGYLM